MEARLSYLINTIRLMETPTRVLLQYLQQARGCGGTYTPDDVHYYDIDGLKRELAKREHIPNKQEAKKIRREKAKVRK